MTIFWNTFLIVSHIAAPNESPPPSKKKALDVLFGETFTQKERKSSNKMAREELIRYRAKDALPLSGNAMKWWRSQDKELPLLSTLAKRYLCIPGNSVPAERIFSTADDIVSAQRSVLRPDHVDQLRFFKKSVELLKRSGLQLTLLLNMSALYIFFCFKIEE